MDPINNKAGLIAAIQQLETKQADQYLLLRDQYYVVLDGLTPSKLIKSALNNIESSPYLIDNILTTITGLVTGYLSKKIFIGTSGNIFRKVLGSVLQFGITNIISQHPEIIRIAGQFISQKLFRKRNKKLPDTDE